MTERVKCVWAVCVGGRCVCVCVSAVCPSVRVCLCVLGVGACVRARVCIWRTPSTASDTTCPSTVTCAPATRSVSRPKVSDREFQTAADRENQNQNQRQRGLTWHRAWAAQCAGGGDAADQHDTFAWHSALRERGLLHKDFSGLYEEMIGRGESAVRRTDLACIVTLVCGW